MFDSRVAVRKLALSAAWFSGLARISGPYLRGMGTILMLHRVTSAPPGPLGINRHLTVTPDFLDAALTEMKRTGFRFVTMDALTDRLSTPAGAGRPLAVVTLDDAFRDNLVEALPVFERHETPFTIHVAPGLIDGRTLLWWEIVEEIVTRCERIALPAAAGGGWLACGTPAEKRRADAVLTEFLTCRIEENEQGRALRELAGAAGIEVEATGRKLLMNWEEIGRIAAHPLAAIGAHSVSHFNLRRLSDEAAWQEITAPIEILERRLGVRPRHMAYPYGFAAAVGPREVRMAREAGFRTAVTTRHGVVHAAHGSHLHALPRISLNGRYQRIAYLGTMLSGITTPMANYGRRLVTV